MHNDKRIKLCRGQHMWLATVVGVFVSAFGWPAESKAVTVAVVRSWGAYTVLPIFEELDQNWSAYGSTPLTIDTSLRIVDSFTYQDLVDTHADVLWLSDPAGGKQQYSSAEVDAIERYVGEGYSILGTYKVFQHFGSNRMYDNRALATIFGLRSDIAYNLGDDRAAQAFNVVVPSELFRNLPDPYVTSGHPQAEVPADDLRWDAGDLGAARLMACTSDNRGIITWYETEAYHAIYVSEMVEYYGNSADTQFLYNALTIIPEPSALVLLGVGTAVLIALMGRRRTQRAR